MHHMRYLFFYLSLNVEYKQEISKLSISRVYTFLLGYLPTWRGIDYVCGSKEGESEDMDPDAIKDLLEDAVVLGKAHFRLNTWRQKCFSEFLTEVIKCSLKECIQANKQVFPDKFHAKTKSEHEYSSTNKLRQENLPIHLS